MNDAVMMRMVDANGNRAREALRVMEDYARFGLNDAGVSAELKGIRHGLAAALAGAGLEDAVLFRNTVGDVGTTIETESEFARASLGEVVVAAGKRLSEALRVLEECVKAIAPERAAAVEKLRYRGYVVEQTLSRFTGGADLRGRFANVRLYVLLTESLCHAAVRGWERMLDVILEGAGSDGRRLCVQLREKGLEDGELLRRAKVVAAKCRAAGAVSMVNDRPDIALLAGADGVHVGQDDLPCAEVRKMCGQGLMVGVSTGEIAEAKAAVREGATYVAVGPMFETRTKEKPRVAGVGYAAEVVREVGQVLPVVAIGGITVDGVTALTAVGVRTVAVCSSIIGQPSPASAVHQMLERLRG